MYEIKSKERVKDNKKIHICCRHIYILHILPLQHLLKIYKISHHRSEKVRESRTEGGEGKFFYSFLLHFSFECSFYAAE